MSERTYHKDGTLPKPGAIWVFGSNLAGIHGAGAAKVALHNFGAAPGCGEGPTGDSYAIPTKDAKFGVRSRQSIADCAVAFIDHARKCQAAAPDLRFFVTRIGCGYAGYSDADMAPLFRGAPSNCSFAEEWRPWLD